MLKRVFNMRHLFYKIFLVLIATASYLQAQPDYSSAESKEQTLISHVQKSIELAEKGISKLNLAILNIHGMSSPIIRHFLNNICSLTGANYLEIGCWKGSTLVAAGYHNPLQDIIAIDNWSQFDGPKAEFQQNVHTYL